MIPKKLLITGAMSTLLLTSVLFAENHCVNGACFVSLDNLEPPKNLVSKKKDFVVLNKPSRETNIKVINQDSLEDINSEKAFDVVIDNKLIVMFPSYVMTKNEKIKYLKEQKAIALNKKYNQEENRELKKVTQIVEKIEDTILDKAQPLPSSDYYCDDHAKPVYHIESDSFECA